MTTSILDLPDEILSKILSELYEWQSSPQLMTSFTQTNERIRRLSTSFSFQTMDNTPSLLQMAQISTNRNLLENVKKIYFSAGYLEDELYGAAFLLSLTPKLKKLEIYSSWYSPDEIRRKFDFPQAVSIVLSGLKFLEYLDLRSCTGFRDSKFRITTIMFPRLKFLALPDRLWNEQPLEVCFDDPLKVRDIVIFANDTAVLHKFAHCFEESIRCITFDGSEMLEFCDGISSAIDRLAGSQVSQLKFENIPLYIFGVDTPKKQSFWNAISSSLVSELYFYDVELFFENDETHFQFLKVKILALEFLDTYIDENMLSILHKFLIQFPNLTTLQLKVNLVGYAPWQDDSEYFRVTPVEFMVRRPVLHCLVSLIQTTSIKSFRICGEFCNVHYTRIGEEAFQNELSSNYFEELVT